MNKLLVKVLTTIVVGMGGVTSFATQALAKKVDVVIVNDADDQTIDQVYLARPGKPWGVNRIDGETLNPGERTFFEFNTGNSCIYNLKIGYQISAGYNSAGYDLLEEENMCKENTLIFYGEGGTNTDSPSP